MFAPFFLIRNSKGDSIKLTLEEARILYDNLEDIFAADMSPPQELIDSVEALLNMFGRPATVQKKAQEEIAEEVNESIKRAVDGKNYPNGWLDALKRDVAKRENAQKYATRQSPKAKMTKSEFFIEKLRQEAIAANEKYVKAQRDNGNQNGADSA